jgi:hypothetical protein
MPKYMAAFVSAVAVTALTVLPILVPPEHISWLRWRIGAIACGLIATVALGMQLYMQYQEEKKMREEDERRNRERDKKIDEVLRRLPKQRRTLDSASGTLGFMLQQETLAERLAAVAHDCYASLQDGITLDAYNSRLKPRLLGLLPELQKAPIKTHITETDINLKRDQLTAQLRQTADKLALSAIRMTYPKTKISGNFLVLDEDESH